MNVLAQTFTAAASQAIEQTIGWGGVAGIGATVVGMILAYLRGIRLLAPIVAAVEWFRRDGARGFDLSRYGLSVELQERIRADLQLYLWASLRDAIASLADKLGLLKAVDARVQAITEPLKALAAAEGTPVTVEEKAAAVRRTTGVMPAFRPESGPPALGALLLALTLLLAPGCVAAEAVHASERLAATARVIEAAATNHDAYAAQGATESAAALAGFVALAHEHRQYADELVAAAGGDPARVDALVDEWIAAAAERKKRRQGGVTVNVGASPEASK